MPNAKQQPEKHVKLKKDIVIPAGTVISLAGHKKEIFCEFYGHVIGVGKNNTAYLILFDQDDAATRELFEPVN